MLELPRGYLSYSAMMLFLKNKNAFRAKYYRNEQQIETVEMSYGKQIASFLEDDEQVKKHPILKQIPTGGITEYEVQTEIGGVPVLGRIDRYFEETHSFHEIKTGHKSHSGGAPWDRVKVRQHQQLPFYSLLIEVSTGKVDPLCKLIWIETMFTTEKREFNGHTLETESRILDFTGRVEVFERRITKWERKRMQEQIISVAQQIDEDFKTFKENERVSEEEVGKDRQEEAQSDDARIS